MLAEVSGLRGEQATARLQEMYAEPIREELITERLREIRDAGVTVAGSLSPQRTREFAKTVVDAGVDMFVIRGYDGQRRARLVAGRAAQPQGVHLRARRPGDRRRLRHPSGRAAPDAHRRGRRTGRLRRRCRTHHPHRPRRRRPDGLRGRRRRRRPSRLPRRVRRPLRARHRGRLDRQVRRHRQGGRLRRRRGDGRLAVRPRHRRARATASTGVPRRTTSHCPAASGSSSRPSAPSRRSCSAPPASPTAP